ncbi:uncharacterized protein LOC144631432 [Oculina patagonica]
MKTDVMPLGFQFCPHPDQGKRCDLANCTISIDTPWKMFEGCWHSFHISCLDVVDVCPICRKGIENAMRSLSAVANKSVHAQGNAGDTDANDGSGGVEGAAENDDAGVEEPLTSSTDENVDQVLQSLTLKIMAFPVRPPPVQPLSSVRSCTSPQPQTSQPTSSTRSNTSSQPPTSSTSSSTSSQPPTSSTRSNTSSQPPTSLTSSSTSSQPTPSQPSSQRRPPHCGTCGHIQQGHHRLVSCETLDELQHLVARPNHTKLAAVLILPPDKSMLLLIGVNGESMLMESHTHQGTGAIIASSGPSKLEEMACYIEFMAKRDWTSNPTPFDVTFVSLS